MSSDYMKTLDRIYEYVDCYCSAETKRAYHEFYGLFVDEQGIKRVVLADQLKQITELLKITKESSKC